eukprot:CAMPEP_0116070798 /NCGR_PEP_ID=MMETSP0322-20121206/13301_1 /TAXON_ID=163516 /ORGANISM="Leptocylindrus danicus var. apora, Strain B651" /LENGTH=259 /DNA_ID=CAMNT_0003558829 /DNA_START=123 /DNA_END=902 /DNA_ORIENTATION=+
MFIISTFCDSLRIDPSAFALPTATSINIELDKKYPNRVIYDSGLCICRWGDPLQIGDGICVPGDGGAYYEVVFRLLIFRPFVDEVCVGKIVQSSADGIRVSLGFFNDVYSGLWVWTPNYDDDAAGEDAEEDNASTKEDVVKYEMDIGEKIKFKVKSLNFTKVTKSAKGVQATASTIAHTGSSVTPGTARMRSLSITSDKGDGNVLRRRRSSSIDLTDEQEPPCMRIEASICEDGLGLVSWWEADEDEEEDEDEEGDEEE